MKKKHKQIRKTKFCDKKKGQIRKTWLICAITQGRTSNPDSPIAPLSSSTTATTISTAFCKMR